LFLLKEVREFQDKEDLRDRLIIAVPFYYLRLTVMEILSKADRKFEHVDDVSILYQNLKEQMEQVLIIDILAFPKKQRDTLLLLIRENPKLSVIYLCYQDELPYSRQLNFSKSCFFVEKEMMDTELLSTLTRALQERILRQKQRSTTIYREENAVEKENDNIFARKFGRRIFLKSTAAAAAITGVAMARPGNTVVKVLAEEGTQTTSSEEKVVLNCCRTACLQSCPLEVVVRDGKIVRTKAAKLKGGTDSRICARGSSWQHVVYSDQRIKHPYKRVGKRGSGQWEQITWEEAISTVSKKFNEIRAQYGGGAIAVGFEGGILGPSTSAYQRWASVIGASKLGCNDDQMYIQCIPNTTGAVIDYENAKNIVLLGTNMPYSRTQEFRYISDAINDNGANLIVIDPNYTALASKAHLHAPIRPGTDGALFMALINYIEQNKLTQDDYIKKMTELPFLVKESDGLFLRKSDLNGGKGAGTPEDDIVVWDADANQYGYSRVVANPEIRGSFEINGIKVNTAYQLLLNRIAPFTVEKASKICDLPVSMIEQIAQACADNSAVFFGMGVDHWNGGLGTVMAVTALQLVTGGFKFIPKASAPSISWPLTGFALDEVGHPDLAPVELSPWMLLPLIETGKCQVEGGKTIEQPIKALAFMTGGRANGYQDHNKTVEMMKKVDFMVAADIKWSDNTEYADIVLPASTQMEVDDLMSSTTYLISCQKAIDPLYDSKPDSEIAKLLCEGMGEGKWFEGVNILDITLRGNPTYTQMGMTYDMVRQAGYIPFTQPFTSGQFYTATGRAVLYLERPKPMKDYGQKFDVEKVRLPYFEPPIEAWTQTVDEYPKNPLAEKYPLVYFTSASRYRVHGNFSNSKVLQELETEPSVRVNPKDAHARGIKDGDYVKLYNDRGHVIARCVFNNGIRPGIVDMDRGWQSNQHKEGHFNNLTHTKMEPACYNHMTYDSLCQMVKA
jgi:molybdopterin-containing oxidoreductase family molybdopterin binding subunit